MCADCGNTRHFKKVCSSTRDQVVNKLELRGTTRIERVCKIETVSIDSVHLNKRSVIINGGIRDMKAGTNNIVIPYKIDMGSEGNIIPLFIFKKLFKNVMEDQLKRSIKGHIRLRTYNKTNITQLGTSTVVIKFKNIKNKGVCFL